MVAPPRLIAMPWISAGLVAAMLAAQWLPGAAELLSYDREAVARGELWRIVTGHLVHYSWGHLTNSLLALLPAAWLIESRRRSDLLFLTLSAALTVGMALLLGEPDIAEYRGASAIGLALLMYAASGGLHGDPRWRLVCRVLLAAVIAKLSAETAGWQLRDWQADAGFVPVASSHAVGAATGFAVHLWRRRYRRQESAAVATRS